MKRTFLKSVSALATLAVGGAFAADITGAGATFPFPMYAKWAEATRRKPAPLNYQSIGSSGGIRQIRAKTADIWRYRRFPYRVPTSTRTAWCIFPHHRRTVPDQPRWLQAGELRVTGPVLADVFSADRQVERCQAGSLNPGKTLPTRKHRGAPGDGSGTTFNWTDYCRP